MAATAEIPLFPLNTVLFPGCILDLQIFEAKETAKKGFRTLVTTLTKRHLLAPVVERRNQRIEYQVN